MIYPLQKAMSPKDKWSEETIVYHIYVRSFKDSDNNGIGDLGGIIEKLNYLNSSNNSLGIDAIWLSPTYPSPQIDFGYDVADYKNIDSIFGNIEDFKKLIDEAHNRGIKIMLDFIPNHTSSKHSWFLQSRSSKDNPKRDYYIWADPKKDGGGPPNNWLSVFGGSGWELDPQSSQYYFHSFDKEQPDLNWRNKEVVSQMLDVLRFWLKLGVDGFRVDAVEWILKDENLKDEPSNPQGEVELSDPYQSLIHQYTYALPGVVDIIKKFVEVIEEYNDKFLVTEVWQPTHEVVKLYPQIDRKWFAPFNFGLITHPWNAAAHKEFIDAYDELVGETYFPTYVLGNHDKSRVASRIGEDQAKVAAILLLSLRGMPYIYYGDEIGMMDGKIPQDKILDPFEKKLPGLGLGRDPERTPMQWDESQFAGFSLNEPWLPVAENYKQINVEKESQDPKSMLNLYRELIKIRKSSKPLLYGKYKSLDVGNENVFVFTRTYEGDTCLVVLNYTANEQKVSLPFKKGKMIINTFMDAKKDNVNLSNLLLRPNEGVIYELLDLNVVELYR